MYLRSIFVKKALDRSKDQSYVLYTMSQQELARTRFPLGEMTKDEVRRIASGHGFANSGKKDSQDICFVPDGDYAGMINRYNKSFRVKKGDGEKGHAPGPFLDMNGNVIGTHSGIINYTIGQRRGLGLAAGERIYVNDIDPVKNTVTLSDNASLYRRQFSVRNVSFISSLRQDICGCGSAAPDSRCEDQTADADKGADRLIQSGAKCLVRIRYRHKEQPAVIEYEKDGLVRVTFDEPQRAVTPGQAAVFYGMDGETVLGGGIIQRTIGE